MIQIRNSDDMQFKVVLPPVVFAGLATIAAERGVTPAEMIEKWVTRYAAAKAQIAEEEAAQGVEGPRVEGDI